jgi:hypothetical protein
VFLLSYFRVKERNRRLPGLMIPLLDYEKDKCLYLDVCNLIIRTVMFV